MKKPLNRKIKVATIALLVAAILASVIYLPACQPKEEKKGMIICTALLSGALMYKDSGEPLWDPLTEQVLSMDSIISESGKFDVQIDKLGAAIGNVLGNKKLVESIVAPEDGIIDHLTLDAEGNTNENVIPCTMDSEYCQKFGVFACYEELYNSLLLAYGEEYEVSVFNYDWRLDIRKNGELLEQYIESKEYDKVVLTAHSMGGNVVANYLARSEENRDKVQAFVSYGSPYYGSAMAIDLFENIGGFVDIADDLAETPVGALLGNVDLKGMIENKIIPMAKSWTSLYQLMPWPELLSEDSTNGGFRLEIDGKAITTADELYAFYESRPWAKDENGQVIKAVKELRDFHNSCYVNVNGQKVYSTTLVNTYYVGGYNVDTIAEMIYAGGEYIDWESEATGDGTVLANSSGRTIDSNSYKLLDDVAHIPLGLFDKYTLEPVATAIGNIEDEPKTLGGIFDFIK